jgi:hypothetical protein
MVGEDANHGMSWMVGADANYGILGMVGGTPTMAAFLVFSY